MADSLPMALPSSHSSTSDPQQCPHRFFVSRGPQAATRPKLMLLNRRQCYSTYCLQVRSSLVMRVKVTEVTPLTASKTRIRNVYSREVRIQVPAQSTLLLPRVPSTHPHPEGDVGRAHLRAVPGFTKGVSGIAADCHYEDQGKVTHVAWKRQAGRGEVEKGRNARLDLVDPTIILS